MYSPPKAKNGVYFTKALTESNYKNGEYLLSVYWRASKLPTVPPPAVSYDGMIRFFKDNYPTYIEYLGSLMSQVDSGTLTNAMKKAASKGGTSYPRPSNINNALMQDGVNISDVVVDAAKEIGESLLFGIKGVMVLAVIGGVGYLILMNPKILVNLKRMVA